MSGVGRHLSCSVLAAICFLTILFSSGCGNSKPIVSPQTPSYQLTVTAPPSGAGTITSTPAGINCPSTCTATFSQNTQVKLTATPGNNYFFQGWSGSCSGTSSCTLTITSPQSVAAAFAPGENLTVSISGSGTGTVTSNPPGISCPSTCTAAFPQGTQVTLTESPGSNMVFSSWAGACSGADTCTVTLTAGDSVTANFASNNGTGGGGGNSGSGALIYVSAPATSGSGAQIYGYTADTNGQLTAISGSPFSLPVGIQAGNQKFLFGTDHTNIDSFAIASDGSLSPAGSINAEQHNNPVNCGGGPDLVFLDRTGVSVYDLDLYSDCANNAYQSFGLDAATGALSYLSITSDVSPVFMSALSFTGDNAFAYSASCYHYIQEIYGFKRNTDGTLTLVTPLDQGGSNLPLQPSGDPYCPWLAAADPSNHLAVSLTPMSGSTFQPTGAPVLAAFTVQASGAVSTTNTSADMPSVATTSINDMQMSPDGKYLAVGGTGLQVFYFNGASPITQLTALLGNSSIDELRWDSNDNLYAISGSSGQVFVYNVSSAGATEASGSPYKVSNPQNLVVIPQS